MTPTINIYIKSHEVTPNGRTNLLDFALLTIISFLATNIHLESYKTSITSIIIISGDPDNWAISTLFDYWLNILNQTNPLI